MTRDNTPTPFNMAAHVLAGAASAPDRTALSVLAEDHAENWTYAQLERAVRGTATGLLDTGLVAGDRVLLRLGNTPVFPVAYLGCIAAGLIPVPTSAQLTVPEITALAHDVVPAAVIAEDGIALPHHAAPVLHDLAKFFALPAAPYTLGDPDRAAYIIYTSGTSGRPRGVIHAHRAILARGMMQTGWTGLTTHDRLLHAGAFNWTYTLGTGLLDPWKQGATALIPAAGTPVHALPHLLAHHQATIFAAAPGIYRQILAQAIPALPHLRHGLSAGEKLPQPIREAWAAATGTDIHEAYGMSECSTFISGSPTTPAEAGTLGQPQKGRRIALLKEDGMAADHGQIAVHRSDPGLMLGYWGAPEDTAAKLQGDWFLTGDIGTRTTSGAIHYDGRADDMMNAGGFRVSPIEVEAALATHPKITEAAVAELPVKADTTVIAAFYVSPYVIDEDALAAFCAARLARYKTPRLFIRCDALPRGANNKLLRRRLRQDWEADHGQT